MKITVRSNTGSLYVIFEPGVNQDRLYVVVDKNVVFTDSLVKECGVALEKIRPLALVSSNFSLRVTCENKFAAVTFMLALSKYYNSMTLQGEPLTDEFGYIVVYKNEDDGGPDLGSSYL